MFVCKNCSTQVPKNQPSYLFPIKLRFKQYPARGSANKYKTDLGKEKKSDDPGGEGLEFEKEILVCKNCFDALTANQKNT